jgi:hypothetical protein
MPRVTISAGQVALASVGNDFAQLTYDQPRNGLINGSFEIWQRGTSGLATASGPTNGYGADKWQMYRGGYVGGVTAAQTTGTGQTRYAMRVQRTAGNTSTNVIILSHNMESANSKMYAGQQVTLSAWVRCGANYSSTNNYVEMTIISGDGTDQRVSESYTNRTTVATGTKTLTTSWQRLSVTGTVSSNASQIAVELYYTPTGTAGANDWFEITGAQLEIGARPTTFQMSGGSVAAELAACQRTYQRHGLVSGAFVAIGYGSGTTTTNTFWSISPAMRIAPTSVGFNLVQLMDGTGGTIAVTGLALHNPTTTRAIIHVTHAVNDTAHRPYGLVTTSGSGYVELNAEV